MILQGIEALGIHRETVRLMREKQNEMISDKILQGIEALGNHRETVRLIREKLWIRRLHTNQMV